MRKVGKARPAQTPRAAGIYKRIGEFRTGRHASLQNLSILRRMGPNGWRLRARQCRLP